jgi:DNA-binding NtrC family response regulator
MNKSNSPNLRPSIRNRQSGLGTPESPIPDLQSAIGNPQSAIHNPSSVSILLADDNEGIRETVPIILGPLGYAVAVYNPLDPEPELLAQTCDVAILDIMMPHHDGFALREKILQHSPNAQFIIMTGQPDKDKLDRAMNLGVFTFLTKPFSAEQITYAVMGALRFKHLLEKNMESDFSQDAAKTGLIGQSAAMRTVRRRILELAPIDISVLITGESGTGKEVVARCIHQYSRRKEKLFTTVNCAGLSPNLVESELFGHAQGAFTGASKTKYGFFEVSTGGTLFLDEIGEFPLELQSRLLRVLDRGEFNRVGETVMRTTDVRIISATNRDLKIMVDRGSFRADLYYRLHGAQIHIPPLRDRKDDIPDLVRFFLAQDKVAVAPGALDRLAVFDWPGNVRELRMVVQNLQALASNSIITVDAVAGVLGQSGTVADGEPLLSYKHFKETVLAEAERNYFRTLVGAASGNIAQAARDAGMHRKNLYEKLKQFRIDY